MLGATELGGVSLGQGFVDAQYVGTTLLIDLTHIIYRAHQIGDMDESKNIPSIIDEIDATNYISLAGIKFRSKEIGDSED